MAERTPIVGMGPTPPTSWTWPVPTLPSRYNTSVTEIMDLAADGRRVAVIEGAIWPTAGSRIAVNEDEARVRAGIVERVELVLAFRGPAKVVVWATLEPVEG